MFKKLTKTLTNYDSDKSIGYKLRAKRIVPLLNLIKEVSQEYGNVDIIDIGGTKQYWNIIPMQYLQENKVSITLVNLPGTNVPEDDDMFKFVQADGADLSLFADNSFHIAHSNSVLEHVGDWDKMVQFSREFKRLAKRYFIQTPNYWFPIEPHCMTPFYHWLPKPTRLWLVSHFALGNWSKAVSTDDAVRQVESARLLNKKMFCALFEDAEVTAEQVMFLAKSFVAIKK